MQKVEERTEIAGRIFFCYEEEIDKKRIGVIDDSIVRGINSREIISRLRRYGASAVHFFSAWPEFRNACRMGIDVATREELAAHGRTLEEIKQFIGSDTLNYATIEDVVAAIGTDGLCMACVDGNYPSNFRASEPVLVPL
jgi:amidophosphoribosyltransferase